ASRRAFLVRPEQTGGVCRPTSEPRQAPPRYRAPISALTVLIMDDPGRLIVLARSDRDRAGSGRKRPPNPQTHKNAREAGEVPVAGGRADVLRKVAPGSAADAAATAISTGPRRTICGRFFVIFMIAILHPLPHIAGHVVEAERIGRERSDRRGLTIVPFA